MYHGKRIFHLSSDVFQAVRELDGVLFLVLVEHLQLDVQLLGLFELLRREGVELETRTCKSPSRDADCGQRLLFAKSRLAAGPFQRSFRFSTGSAAAVMTASLPFMVQNGNFRTFHSASLFQSVRALIPAHLFQPNGGKSAALLQLLHESPAAEFTDGDGAKCNLISAHINHLVLFFWRAICLEPFSYRGRCPVTQKKLRWGEKGGRSNKRVKDYENSDKSFILCAPSTEFAPSASSRGESRGITHN